MVKTTILPATLKDFRDKVQLYCRLADRTQYDLAAALGLAYPSLNKKLTGQRSLSQAEVKQIILALAGWQSFDTFEQISELLKLAGYSEPGLDWLFNAEERQRLLIEAPAPARPTTANRHNLPQLASSFIGRQLELAQLRDLLVHSRQTTLVGTGGCGKTRLALEVARQLVPSYSGGVWLVELASLNAGELILKTVAVTLGVKEQAGQSLLESLTKALKGYGHTLLVLDNCEHLLAATSTLVTDLLKACPHLAVLATSREKLGDELETVFEVGPLEVPPIPATKTVQTAALNLTELRRFDSVRLFEERARQSLVSFKLERSNAAAVRDICADLDGIPLALELAASRLEALSVNQLRTRLGERFRLLSRDKDTATARHQTLRALFDWSYELLTPAEQQLFCQLGIFVGGCTIDAAQAVLDVPGLDIPAGLESLILKNLLKLQIDKAGQRRYLMLQTVQQYALEKLDHYQQLPTLKRRYWTYFSQLVETLAPQLINANQITAHLQLDSDYSNLRQVLNQVIEISEVEIALSLGNILGQYWDNRAYWDEGSNYLEQISALVKTNTLAKANILKRLGTISWSRGDLAKSKRLYEEVLAITQLFNDMGALGIAYHNLGVVSHLEGNYQQSINYFKQALILKREAGDKNGTANTLNNLGATFSKLGKLEEAHIHYEDSLLIYRGVGNKRMVAEALVNLGSVFHDKNAYIEAHRYYAESLALLKETNDQRGIATALKFLGDLFFDQALFDEAQHFYDEALTLQRELGDKRGIISCLKELSAIYSVRGDFRQALTYLKESLAINQDLRSNSSGVDILLNLTRVTTHIWLNQNQKFLTFLEFVTILLGLVVTWMENGGGLEIANQRIYNDAVRISRENLDQTTYATCFAEGKAMNLQQAIELALAFIENLETEVTL